MSGNRGGSWNVTGLSLNSGIPKSNELQGNYSSRNGASSNSGSGVDYLSFTSSICITGNVLSINWSFYLF